MDAGCGNAQRRSGGAPFPVLRDCSSARRRRLKKLSYPSGRWRSKRDLRSIGGDLPARALGYLALLGVVQQRRIGIVDMQKYLPPDIEPGQASDRAAIARHRDMSHVLARL